MSEDGNASIVWFLAGLGVGAVIGVVTAPRDGAATRRLIGVKAEEAGGFIAANGREYFDRGRELYEKGRQLADEAAELFDEGRRMMENVDATDSTETTA